MSLFFLIYFVERRWVNVPLFWVPWGDGIECLQPIVKVPDVPGCTPTVAGHTNYRHFYCMYGVFAVD